VFRLGGVIKPWEQTLGGVLLHHLCTQWAFAANISLDLETDLGV